MQLLIRNEEISKIDELREHIYDKMKGLYYALIGNQNVPLMNSTV